MNYYKVLNISTKADDKEIKKAYRLLAKKYHPDMYEGDKSYAEDKMQEINEAYDTLSNADLRKEYDKSIGLYKEPEVTNTYDYNKRTSTSYSNTRSYNNVRYRPNNANTYYDSYGYAETNYSAYTGDRYTRNRYEERIKLDKKDVAIKIGIILFIGIVILICFINMIVESVSQLTNSKIDFKNDKLNSVQQGNPTKETKPKYYYQSEEDSQQENINSSSTNKIEYDKELKEAYNKFVNDLGKIEIDEEAVEEKLNELLQAIEKYNSQSSN